MTTEVTVHALVATLDTAVVELLEAPSNITTPVISVALLDADDLATEIETADKVADICLVVGVPKASTSSWLLSLADRPPQHRPTAVMAKIAPDSEVRAAAKHAGIALIAVHKQARWEHVFALVSRQLDRLRRSPGLSRQDDALLDNHTDLFDLAQVVADNAGGLVSIEDAQSAVLAYSASDDTADELRTLSIMGRQGPREYLQALHRLGVFDRLRESDEVVDIPAHPELQTRRRLVVSVRDPSQTATSPRLLGSIWVQEGANPFSADADDVLRGASAVAARIIYRNANAPNAESVLVQRLFGEHGGGVDVPTIVAALNLAHTGPAAVIGFAAANGLSEDQALTSSMGSLLRLHASSFRRDAVVTTIGPRAYVLLPQYKSPDGVVAWLRQLVDRIEAQRGLILYAAIALPVAGLPQVAGARAEVDRVLNATTASSPTDRVTTLAESLTPVLLGEILDLISEHPTLADPRVTALDDYDRLHDGSLHDSVRAYIQAHGDVRRAAAMVNVHHNTLRYRLRRAEEILGVRFSDHSDRLLLAIQLAVIDRAPASGLGV